MLTTRIVHPETVRKRSIKCRDCGLEYPKAEHLVLFNANKLKYFKLKDIEGGFTVCHDCLFFLLKTLANGEPISFRVLSKDNDYVVEFFPEQFFSNDEADSENKDDDDSMEDFLGDIE